MRRERSGAELAGELQRRVAELAAENASLRKAAAGDGATREEVDKLRRVLLEERVEHSVSLQFYSVSPCIFYIHPLH
jgi:hypothetical protein